MGPGEGGVWECGVSGGIGFHTACPMELSVPREPNPTFLSSISIFFWRIALMTEKLTAGLRTNKPFQEEVLHMKGNKGTIAGSQIHTQRDGLSDMRILGRKMYNRHFKLMGWGWGIAKP